MFISKMKRILGKEINAVRKLTKHDWEIFAEDTQNSVHQILSDKPLCRPSHAKRKLESAAKWLQKALDDIKSCGKLGELLLRSASPRLDTDNNIQKIMTDLELLAKAAQHTATTAKDYSKSMLSHKGGLERDHQILTTVCRLVDIYRDSLQIKPTHITNPDDGFGISIFDEYVKLALTLFNPRPHKVCDSMIEKFIRHALSYRDLEIISNEKELNNLLK